MENNTSGNGLEEFLNISVSAHDNFALRKKKYSRRNSAFFMKNYWFEQFPSKKENCSEQNCLYYRICCSCIQNYCVSLLQKTKRNYYTNLNEETVAGNRQFCRTIKPVLSEKVKSAEKIILVEGDKIINEDGRNATVLVKQFIFYCY